MSVPFAYLHIDKLGQRCGWRLRSLPYFEGILLQRRGTSKLCLMNSNGKCGIFSQIMASESLLCWLEWCLSHFNCPWGEESNDTALEREEQERVFFSPIFGSPVSHTLGVKRQTITLSKPL